MRLFLSLLLSLPLLAFASSNSLTPGLYKTLNEVQEQLTAQNYTEAQTTLTKLESKLDTGFGLALVYQLHGQMLLMQEQPAKALDYFQKALDLNVLEPAQEAGIATTTAQILLSLDRAKEAYAQLEPRIERILALEQEEMKKRRGGERKKVNDLHYVQPHTMVTLATACQMQKHYRTSIPWLRKALKRSDSPKESWLLMLMVALYQEKQYESAAEVLDDLQRLNPSKEDYWQQQAAMYQMAEKPALALRSLELGYAAGYITKSANILQLAQMLISEGLPERAARILQTHLDDNTLELNETNWRILASAWLQGRERQEAVKAMHIASSYMHDGSLIFRAAQLQAQDSYFNAALSDVETALKKGLNDKDKPQALMLAASSAYELRDINTSRRYFQQALNYASTASNAKSWLDYLGTIEQVQRLASAD